jgi:hypothetical protein
MSRQTFSFLTGMLSSDSVSFFLKHCRVKALGRWSYFWFRKRCLALVIFVIYIINKPVKLCCPGAVDQVAVHLPRQLIPVLQDSLIQRFSMELDLQSLFGLHVTWCAQLYSLAETPQLPPPPAFGLAFRVSTEFRRHGIPSVFFTSVYSVFRAELDTIPAKFRRIPWRMIPWNSAEFHGIPWLFHVRNSVYL